jgi:hypothetical protein
VPTLLHLTDLRVHAYLPHLSELTQLCAVLEVLRYHVPESTVTEQNLEFVLKKDNVLETKQHLGPQLRISGGREGVDHLAYVSRFR